MEIKPVEKLDPTQMQEALKTRRQKFFERTRGMFDFGQLGPFSVKKDNLDKGDGRAHRGPRYGYGA